MSIRGGAFGMSRGGAFVMSRGGARGWPGAGAFVILASTPSIGQPYRLHAINRNGSEAWSAGMGSLPINAIHYSKGLQKCFVTIENSPIKLRAVDTADGTILWTVNPSLDSPIISSSAADNLVYGFVASKLTAFDADTGAQVWQHPTAFTGPTQIGTVAATPGFVYVAGTSGIGGTNQNFHKFTSAGTYLFSAYGVAASPANGLNHLDLATADDGSVYSIMFYGGPPRTSLARLSDVDGSIVWESTKVNIFGGGTPSGTPVTASESIDTVYANGSRTVIATRDGTIIRDATPSTSARATGLSDCFRISGNTIQRITVDATSATVVWTWDLPTFYPGSTIPSVTATRPPAMAASRI